jgi:hypothetical protein
MNLLDYLSEVLETKSMGRGRKSKIQKMKNRQRQAAKKERMKRRRESIHKARLA